MIIFLKKDNEKNFNLQGPRTVTVLLYLNDGYKGGENIFFSFRS